jgi:uncharacterized membrane protein YdfJ with MMPL/SSD domain
VFYGFRSVGPIVGIDSPTPLPPFVAVLMVAVLFGLSMDYELFLVSRMPGLYACPTYRAPVTKR